MALQTPCIYIYIYIYICGNTKLHIILERKRHRSVKMKEEKYPVEREKNLSLYDIPPFLVIKSRRLAELKFMI